MSSSMNDDNNSNNDRSSTSTSDEVIRPFDSRPDQWLYGTFQGCITGVVFGYVDGMRQLYEIRLF